MRQTPCYTGKPSTLQDLLILSKVTVWQPGLLPKKGVTGQDSEGAFPRHKVWVQY